ncbi:MAG: hypothetical protein ABW109_22105 [Candidatus Thiodiazotropha sp. 6PLUC4]
MLCRVEKCENQRYANQSESGEARVTGSNSGGGGNEILRLKDDVRSAIAVALPGDGSCPWCRRV